MPPHLQAAMVRQILLALMWTAFVSVILFGLAGCGGSGGDAPQRQGQLSLSVTDAPMDDATGVIVQFHAVAFKREGDAPEIVRDIDPSPRRLNLLEYQQGRAAVLLNGITLPAGRYEWVRLIVDNEANVRDSYLVLGNGNECELRVPSGAESGLKLNRGFSIPADGSVALTIDFDLRKSVQAPPGQTGSGTDCTQAYLLRPTLRIVDDANVGAIAGTVDGSLVTADCTPQVYIFDGAGVVPDDIEDAAAAGDVDPLVVAEVAIENGSTAYRYHAAFLPPASYTVAFTCSQDDPTDDEVLTFLAPPSNVEVRANLISSTDFAAPVQGGS
jgi:hypothetical protein